MLLIDFSDVLFIVKHTLSHGKAIELNSSCFKKKGNLVNNFKMHKMCLLVV